MIAVLVILVALAAALIYAHISSAGSTDVVASGTIEGIESDLASKVPGRLAALLVSDGQNIRAGQPLARLDPIDQRHGVQAARADLEAARSRVPQARASLVLQSSTVSAQLDQAAAQVAASQSQADASAASAKAADADLASAVAQDVKASNDFARTKQLYAQGFVSAQDLDAARAAAGSASAAVDAARATRDAAVRQLGAARASLTAARAALSLADANRTSIDVAAYNVQADAAARDQAAAALALAQTQLDETTIRAPFDGTVFSHSAEAGDLLEAAAPILTVIKSDSLYLRVYVMEPDLAVIRIGKHVSVTVDGVPGKTFDGIVSEIDDQAQFTPSNVQTKDQRAELVFGVKVDLHDTTGALKPGLPADVDFSVAP
jgi:HlyD family secretion protein